MQRGWDEVLREPLQSAIERFLGEGLLVPSSLRSKLGTYVVKDLKALLKERQLPVSGNRDILIDRLVHANDPSLTEMLAHLDVLECSLEAMDITDKYLEQQKREKQRALAESRALLVDRKFGEACLAVSQYEVRQVFARGVGVNWSKPDPGAIRRLEIIFSSRPKILADLPDHSWEPLRVAAGMMNLWGTATAKEWLPEGFAGVARFTSDTAARMLMFHANYVHSLAEAREMGVRTATISSCGSESCEACREISNKPTPLDELPELPFFACSHEMGCRCLALPDVPDRSK